MLNRIALAGCGNVGTALLEILYDKKDNLYEKFGFKFKVTMITDLVKGTIIDPDGLDLQKVLHAINTYNSFEGFTQFEGSFSEMLDASRATMLAEATPTNLETGEPGLSHIKTALAKGIHVTMTNKGPIAVAMDELQELAKKHNAKMRYEGVIMSGTPLVHMIQSGLAGCTIEKVEGILNGTTNVILTEMEHGSSYDEALKKATELGYAEADPSMDVHGWDSAVKISIIALILFDEKIPVDMIDREGITHITEEKIKQAKERGNKIKLISGIKYTQSGLHAYVAPMEIPLSHPLAGIDGATNAVTLTTDNLGEVTLTGPGAGRKETGQALLADLVAMAK
ncbi:MAG: homoserine dehydrogenase [Synergistaceae bacterium]|nr:homoserine dehydrogenase [Synergistaceae bacterium]